MRKYGLYKWAICEACRETSVSKAVICPDGWNFSKGASRKGGGRGKRQAAMVMEDKVDGSEPELETDSELEDDEQPSRSTRKAEAKEKAEWEKYKVQRAADEANEDSVREAAKERIAKLEVKKAKLAERKKSLLLKEEIGELESDCESMASSHKGRKIVRKGRGKFGAGSHSGAWTSDEEEDSG